MQHWLHAFAPCPVYLAQNCFHAVQIGIKMEGRLGHVHQAQGTYDPITNQWLHAPAGTVAQTAGDRSRQDEHDWAVNKTGIIIMGIHMFW